MRPGQFLGLIKRFGLRRQILAEAVKRGFGLRITSGFSGRRGVETVQSGFGLAKPLLKVLNLRPGQFLGLIKRFGLRRQILAEAVKRGFGLRIASGFSGRRGVETVQSGFGLAKPLLKVLNLRPSQFLSLIKRLALRGQGLTQLIQMGPQSFVLFARSRQRLFQGLEARWLHHGGRQRLPSGFKRQRLSRRHWTGDSAFQLVQPIMIRGQTLSPVLIQFTQRIVLRRKVGLQDVENLPGGIGVCRYLTDQGFQMLHPFLLLLQFLADACGVRQSLTLFFKAGLEKGDLFAGRRRGFGQLIQSALLVLQLSRGGLAGFGDLVETGERLVVPFQIGFQRIQ